MRPPVRATLRLRECIFTLTPSFRSVTAVERRDERAVDSLKRQRYAYLAQHTALDVVQLSHVGHASLKLSLTPETGLNLTANKQKIIGEEKYPVFFVLLVEHRKLVALLPS